MTVGIEIRYDGLARVTLRRAEAGNAIDLDMAHGLLDAARTCAARARTGRAADRRGEVLLRRRRPQGVLPALRRGPGEAPRPRSPTRCTTPCAPSRRATRPLVAAVQGAVAGAGLGLAASADLTLAADTASFTAAYTGIGYSPDAGVSWSCPASSAPSGPSTCC